MPNQNVSESELKNLWPIKILLSLSHLSQNKHVSDYDPNVIFPSYQTWFAGMQMKDNIETVQ